MHSDYAVRPTYVVGCCCPSPHRQSADVTDVQREVLMLALLHERTYKKKKSFKKFIAQYLPCIGLVLFISECKEPYHHSLKYVQETALNFAQDDVAALLEGICRMLQLNNDESFI